VLKAEEAFETLGDGMVARQCLFIAGTMPGIGDVEREVVRERLKRLAAYARASWNEP